MKKILLTWLCVLSIGFFIPMASAKASDVRSNFETFYDESAALKIEEIQSSKFSFSTGEIRQPYQSGNLWMRITAESSHSDLVLYFENPAIDKVLIFTNGSANHSAWISKEIELKELLHGHPLDEMKRNNISDAIVFYLQIKTSGSKQFNVMVLSDKEATLKEHTKYAVLSSQVTAAVILMIWVAMQNWLARSKIFITVVVATPLFMMSRLNYFGVFLAEDSSNSVMYLNLNMILFLSLISGGTLMVKESFGRLISERHSRYFLLFFALSLAPSFGLFFGIPRAHLVMAALIVNFGMVLTLSNYLRSIFSAQRELIWHYKFQLIIFVIYSLMSTLPGFYFIAPQLFPFTLGIPTYRDLFYPVLAFLIMVLMLNEQKEKEMDSIFNLAVTKANAELEIEKNKKQHVFLGMLLHEIKTPLSVIKFGAAALSSDVPKTQLWTSRVDSAADAINHILNQCLLADKLEFGLSGYTAEHINVHLEITKLVERVSYLNPAYLDRIHWQFRSDLPIDTTVSADPVFLRSILENLLTNALKYSAINSTVLLTIQKPSTGNSDFIEFEIKNQIGKVGPPQIDKIFSRYYRAEEAQGYSGTGLGLWLANQQANEMGSSIHCSFDDIWTRFSFQIPTLKALS